MLTVWGKVGIVAVSLLGIYLSIKLIGFIYDNFLIYRIKKAVKLEEIGKWALITGATDGIGKSFAVALAKLGINIILVSRTKSKLDEVAGFLEAEYNVETKTIEADFTKGPEVYEAIEKQLLNIEDIGILINNVGMSYPYPEYFLDMPHNDKLYPNIILCNIMPVTKMCGLVMPLMRERRKGVVINISSGAARMPSPLLTVYAASKAYVEKFTDDLYSEYKETGIVIQCLLPGYVATKMSKIRRASWISPSPDRYVESALKTVGIKSKTTGYSAHTIMLRVMGILKSISSRLPRYVVRTTMENLRQRALNRYT